MAEVKKQPMIKWYGKIFYGTGNLGYGLISQTYSTFIVAYGSIVCGVSGTLIGLAAALGTFWDAVTDPVVGNLSDRTNSKFFGKRHGFILMATFMMAMFNIFLWSVPQGLSQAGMFAWFLIGIIILETSNTLFATPYNALGFELAGDYQERTLVQNFKSVFFVVSLVVPTLLMNFFQKGYAETSPIPYINMAYITSTLGIVFGLVCFFGTYSHLPRLRAKAILMPIRRKKTFKEVIKSFFATLKDRNYRSVMLGSAFSMMIAPILTSAGFHMFTYSFGLADKMYILMGLLFVSTIISQVMWAFLSKILERKQTIILGLGLVLVGIMGLGALFIARGSFADNKSLLFMLLIPVMVVAGLGTGSMFSIPYAMMADIIAYNSKKDKSEKTATYSGFMTLAYKIAQGAAIFFVGVCLDLIGFSKPEAGSTVSSGVEWGLGWIVVIGALLSAVLGIIFFSMYRLKRKEIPEASSVKTPEFAINGMTHTFEQTKLLNDNNYLKYLNTLPAEDYRREIETMIARSSEIATLILQKQELGLLKQIEFSEEELRTVTMTISQAVVRTQKTKSSKIKKEDIEKLQKEIKESKKDNNKK